MRSFVLVLSGEKPDGRRLLENTGGSDGYEIVTRRLNTRDCSTLAAFFKTMRSAAVF
jgi:hypothetical protein